MSIPLHSTATVLAASLLAHIVPEHLVLVVDTKVQRDVIKSVLFVDINAETTYTITYKGAIAEEDVEGTASLLGTIFEGIREKTLEDMPHLVELILDESRFAAVELSDTRDPNPEAPNILATRISIGIRTLHKLNRAEFDLAEDKPAGESNVPARH